MIFRLTVFSNREGIPCNPTGYMTTTQNSKWNKKYRRYAEWKAHIQKVFQETYPEYYAAKYLSKFLRRKPIVDMGPWEVNCIAYFMNKKNADPENVKKGVNDAIFQNDKNVFGTYFYRYDKNLPRVEILITKWDEDALWVNPDLDARYAVSREPIMKSSIHTTANIVISG